MYLIKIKNDTNETTLPEEYRINPRVTKQKNKSDSFSFEVTNEFDKSVLKPFTTLITVVDEESRLFRGRIVGDEADIYNFGIVECEGALSFLKDTFYPPFEWDNSPAALLQSVLDNHNANVEDAKKIYLGAVTVTDPNNYLAVSSEDYSTSLSIIQDKLIGKLGGYLVVRYEDDGTYIDWLTDVLRENSQKIELGENLIDVNVEKSYGDIITRLIPLGAKDETTGKRLDISSVNNGKVYIDNHEGISKYGIISGTVKWDDVTVAGNLLAKANAIVKELAKGQCTITIKAVDLNMVDKTYEKFKLGDWIKTVIPTHGINEFYQLNKIEYYIDEPENNVITLGDIKATSTSTNRENIKDINDVMNSIINPNNNTLMAKQIAGVLNLMNATLRAQKNTAQKQDVRAILFEDLDKASPTFGAMCLGTQGIQIAKQRNELDTDWVWGTAIDFQTIYANYIITGILSDKLGNFYLDMDKGELRMKNGEFEGKIKANEGNIGGFDIGDYLSSSGTATFDFNENDKTIIRNIIEGNTALTDAYLKRYDLNGDGQLLANEFVKVANIINKGNSLPTKFVINPTFKNVNNNDGIFLIDVGGAQTKITNTGYFYTSQGTVDNLYTNYLAYLQGGAVIQGNATIEGQLMMTDEISIGQEDGHGIQLGTNGRINATSASGPSSCTICGVSNGLNAFLGHSYFTTAVRGSVVQISSSSSSVTVGNGYFSPTTNNNTTLGTSTNKWSSVYATNGTIQTSDKNQKKNINELNDKYEQLFEKIVPVSYELTYPNSDRTHLGFISQDVEKAMNEVGLTDLDFAGFCKDIKQEFNEETNELEDVLDENGNPEYSYSLRYSEFIALNTHMIQKLQDEVKELKEEINKLKGN